MKKAALFVVASLLASSTWAQCNPVGWVLVGQKVISVSETMCVYEKNGAKLTIMVGGMCPISPC